MRHKFNDILSLVLEERKNSYKSVKTAAWELKMSRKIYSYFEDRYVEDIDDLALNRFFSCCRYKENGDMYSDKYIKELYILVKESMRKALMKGYININPMDYGFKRPKGNIPEAQERLVSKDDLKLLFSVIPKYPKFNIIIPVLLLTGMRVGELLGLFWSDIDFDNKVINIRRAVSDNYVEVMPGKYVKKGVKLTFTKTETSVREIPVSDFVLNLLREWLLYRDIPENSKWRKRIEDNENLNLVFPNYCGRITDYKTLYDSLKDMLKTEHLENCGILFHKLRHNYATDLLSAGVDISVVSKLLGHKDIKTTANTYTKVELEPKIEAIKRQVKYLQKTNLLENIS